MLFYGADDKVTFAGNYVHNVSGRAPKVGGNGAVTMHAVNNFFASIDGHSFDIGSGAKVVIEGNVYENVKTPFVSSSSTAGGSIYSIAGSGCTAYLGRPCVANTHSGSGSFTAYSNTAALSAVNANVYPAVAASGVKALVLANAGIGKTTK